MAILPINRVQGGASASASTIVSPSANHTAGNLLVALMTFDAAGTFSSIADTAGNTWIQAGVEFLSVSANNRFRIYYAYNCLGNATNVVTVTLGGNTVYRSIVVHQFSGIFIASDPLVDSKTGGAMSGTAIATTQALSVSFPPQLIIGNIIGLHDTIVGGTGYTLVNFAITGDVNKYFADEYKIVNTSETASATQGNGAWDIKAATFKASNVEWSISLIP